MSQRGPDLPGMTCVELIGSGGYADVYLYEQAQPRMRVAVKLIKTAVLDDQKRRQFVAEADVMAELAEHPFIVPVLGAGTAPDGRPYLVMRYYPSADLAVRVAQSPMSVPEVLRYGVQLSSAVETAHQAGIVHRDIKPSNILLSSYGQPGLSDFGIAGRPGDVTDDDADMGVSIPWSPPEVLTGASNGSVTSDVYSLAATVWNLLVGRAPFHVPGGDNSERATLARIVHGRPTQTGRDDVPASLDRLLQQALAKQPSHRPQSALELARHFQRVEQELKLSRTEVVVLEADVTTSPVRDVAPGADLVADGPALTTSRPLESPSIPPSDVTTNRNLATDGTESDSTASDSRATQLKAPKRVGPVQERPSASDGETSRPTQYRPRVVAPEEPASEVLRTPPDVAETRGRRLLVAGAGAAVLLAVGVGAVIVGTGSHRGGADAGARDQPSPPIDTSLGDAAPASGGPVAPTAVTATVRGGGVVFRWAPVPGASSYSWVPDGGTGGTVTTPRLVVGRAASGPTCVTVSSLAAGFPASLGTRGCLR